MAAEVNNRSATQELQLPNFLNLTDDQVDKINQLALEYIGTNAKVWELTEKFNTSPFFDKFWHHENFRSWPIFAIKSYMLGHLSPFQAATIIFQYAAVSQFVNEIQAYKIQSGKDKANYSLCEPPLRRDANPRWIHVSNKHFDEILTRSIEIGRGKYHLKTKDDIEKAVAYIKISITRAPLSEQFIFMIDWVSFMENCSEILSYYKNDPFPFSGSFFLGDKLKFAFPSFSILQAFFDYLWSGISIPLEPIIRPLSNFNESRVWYKNKIQVNLPPPFTSPFIFTNGMFAGRAGFIMHNIIHQSFNSFNDYKIIIYILNNLLRPYILKNENLFNECLDKFFVDYGIEDKSKQENLKAALKLTGDYINLKISEKTSKLLGFPCELGSDLKLKVSDCDLTGIDSEKIAAANNELISLKNLLFKICIAKKLEYMLCDKDLENAEEKPNLTVLFSDTASRAVLSLNRDIYDLIVEDQNKKAELWESEFGITSDALKEIEDIVEDFEDYTG